MTVETTPNRVAPLPPPAVAEALNGASSTGGQPQRRRRSALHTLEVELIGGEIYTVKPIYADILDTRRNAKKIGAQDDDQLQNTFTIWTALKRTGQIRLTYPEFEKQVAEVWDITEEDDDSLDPTQTDL